MKTKIVFIDGKGNPDNKERLCGPKRVAHELSGRLGSEFVPYHVSFQTKTAWPIYCYRIIRQIQPQIIHGHGSLNMGLLLAILKALFKKKTILTFTDFKKNVTSNYKILNRLDGIVVQSEYAKRRLVRSGVKSEKVHKILYGVEDIFLKGEVCKEIRDFGKKIVLYYGDARRERGFHLLLDAIPRVKEDVFFVVCIRAIYDNIKYNTFKDRKNVKFLTMDQYPCSTADIVASSDVIVLPFVKNTFEPPLTLMETTSVGKPLITSSVGGNEEVVSESDVIMEELSGECLARCIDRFFEKRSPKHVRKFRWDETLKKMKVLYR